jgi:hypothetical protein
MGAFHRPATEGRLRRLAEELEEVGLVLDADERHRHLLLTEVDHALRPVVHERRIPSTGSILEPASDPATWEAGTELTIVHGPIQQDVEDSRRFADGLSSWLIRRLDGDDEWCVFDRPSGSERDLVVISAVLDGVVVQRHPTGAVRVVGGQGVLRWDGLDWRLEPPLDVWIGALVGAGAGVDGDGHVLTALLEFAVHDLGSRGIGATLVYRPDGDDAPAAVEARLPTPPPLQITRATTLAPLRHALGQVDGAAVFGPGGVLEQLGVRLAPSPEAEGSVAGLRGMRHTSGRRYSYDDPTATVVVVSEDGPVTVFRAGEVLGTSPTTADAGDGAAPDPD